MQAQAEDVASFIRQQCGPIVDANGFVPLVSVASAITASGQNIELQELTALIETLPIETVDGKVHLSQFLQHGVPLLRSLTRKSDDGELASSPDDISLDYSKVAYMKEIFSLCDKDGDGKIYKADLHELVQRLQGHDPAQSLPPDSEAIDLLMAQLDTEGKGYVDFDDFLRGSLKVMGSSFAQEEHSLNPRTPVTSPYKTTPSIAITSPKSIDEFSLDNGSLPSSTPTFGTEILDAQTAERLRQTNHQLSLKLSALESRLSQSQTSQMELLDKVRESEAQLAALKKQAKQVQELQNERRQLIEEMESLKVTVKELKEQLREASKKEVELNLEKQNLTNELIAKQKELNDAADELRRLRAKPAEQKMQRSESSSGLSAEDLQTRIENLKKDKESLEQKLASILKINQQLQFQKEESDALLEEARKKIKELEEESLVQSGSKRSGKSLLSELEGSLKAQAQPLVESLESEKQQLLQRISELEKQHAASEQAVQQFLEQIRTLEQTNDQLKSQTRNLENEQLALQQRLEAATSQLAALEEQNKRLLSEQEQLSARGQQTEAEKQELATKLLALEQEKVQLLSQIAAIEKQLQSNPDDNAVDRLSSRLAQLELEKGALNSQVLALSHQKATLESNLNNLQAEYQELTSKVEELTTQLENAEAAKVEELRALQAKMRALEAEHSRMAEKLVISEQAVARLQSEKEFDLKTIERLTQEKASADGRVKMLEDQQQQLLTRLKEIEDRVMHTAAPQSSDERADPTFQIATAIGPPRSKSSSRKSSPSHSPVIRATNAELESELFDLRNAKAALEEEVRRLREQLDKMQLQRQARRAPGRASRSALSDDVVVSLDETPLIDNPPARKDDNECCSCCNCNIL